ncbi:hypothetical protein PCYB_133440 [Plasmodium cynomolgi strain B]|uniref:14-3-3 domain-containing protein n=1 Tax=Plasmodium cynomolgi (strain B) TaxID=1120755 RepID=K6V0D1_PLACD|nr:hypothetical protein PCYB_133440 [Plasmodium cynomolgi strain B]GAB68470.1 hypothetical protein PCYB_133440 [Plasmodium cynomolgi strain B]
MKAAERNAHVSNRRPPLLVAKRKGAMPVREKGATTAHEKGATIAHEKGATTAHEKGATSIGHARQSSQKKTSADERKDALKINIKGASAESITNRATKEKATPIMHHKSDRKKDKAVNGRTKDKGMHSTGSTHPSSSHRKNNAGVEKPQNLVKSSGNADLNVCLNRESVHSFLRLSYKYRDYEYCVGFVMGDDPSEKKTLQNEKRKNICRSIRGIIKDKFLLNCEAIINVVNCILCTINEEKEKIYYTHLNANQYRTISDITETGVKYKYEQLARETYKKAFELAQVHLVPTDVHFLQLASRYISFLYFNVGKEQLALKICTDVFDRTADELGNMEDEGEADKCLQILSRMRYNIKRWSRKLHGNSILFLDF